MVRVGDRVGIKSGEENRSFYLQLVFDTQPARYRQCDGSLCFYFVLLKRFMF